MAVIATNYKLQIGLGVLAPAWRKDDDCNSELLHIAISNWDFTSNFISDSCTFLRRLNSFSQHKQVAVLLHTQENPSSYLVQVTNYHNGVLESFLTPSMQEL